MFRLGLFLTFIYAAHCQTYNTVPENTAVKIGDEAVLECNVNKDGQTLVWKNYVGSESNIYDSASDTILDDRFDVIRDPTGNQYDLVVKTAQMDLAGQYGCNFPIKDRKETADLVVVDDMECPDGGLEMDDGDTVNLECKVPYKGYKAPSLDWYDENWSRQGDNSVDKTDHVISNATIVASPELNEMTFYCNLTFDTGTDEKDAPTYTDFCHTNIYVNHAVTGMEFQPDPDNFPGQVIEIYAGESINCTASGRPAPAFRWLNEAGEEMSTSDRLFISLDLLGQHTVTCEASNEFNGPRTISRQVTFSAVEDPASSSLRLTSESFVSLLAFSITAAVLSWTHL